MMKQTQMRAAMFAVIIGYTIIVRLLPYFLHGAGIEWHDNLVAYVWNLSPVFAVSLFAGAQLPSRRTAILLPLVLMLVSDLGIWLLTGRVDWAFYPEQFFVYGSFALCAAVGFVLRDRRSIGKITGAGFVACTVFFLITNLAHWAFQDTFPKTGTGLLACYIAGLVTYRNSLIGTALYGSILFSPLLVHAIEPKPSVLAKTQVEA